MLNLLTSTVFPSLIASFGWGVSPIFQKLNTDILEKDNLLAFFLHVSGIALLTIMISGFFWNKLKKLKGNPNLNKILVYTILGAFFSSLVGYYFYFKALASTSQTTIVVLISYIVPLVFTSVLSYIFLSEKFNLGMIFGLLISILGIGIYTYYSA